MSILYSDIALSQNLPGQNSLAISINSNRVLRPGPSQFYLESTDGCLPMQLNQGDLVNLHLNIQAYSGWASGTVISYEIKVIIEGTSINGQIVHIGQTVASFNTVFVSRNNYVPLSISNLRIASSQNNYFSSYNIRVIIKERRNAQSRPECSLITVINSSCDLEGDVGQIYSENRIGLGLENELRVKLESDYLILENLSSNFIENLNVSIVSISGISQSCIVSLYPREVKKIHQTFLGDHLLIIRGTHNGELVFVKKFYSLF